MRNVFCKTLYICCHIFLTAASVSLLSAQDGQPRKDNSNDPPRPLPAMGHLLKVACTADGKLALAGDSDRNIWIWDIAKRKLTRVIEDRSRNSDTSPCFAFSNDGKLAVVGNRRGNGQNTRLDPETLSLWDLEAGVRLRALELKDEPVYAVAMSPDGKRALSISHWKTTTPPGRDPSMVRWFEVRYYMALRLWDTSNGKLVRTLHEDGATGPLTFSPDGSLFFEGRAAPKPSTGYIPGWAVTKWKTTSGELLGFKQMAAEWPAVEIATMAFSPDGKNLALGSYGGASLWNLETGKLVWHYSTHQSREGVRWDDWPVTSVAYCKDGSQIVASGSGCGFVNGRGCGRGGMVVLETSTGKPIPGFADTKEAVGSVSFTPDGKMLLGACPKGLRLWDARTGEAVFTMSN